MAWYQRFKIYTNKNKQNPLLQLGVMMQNCETVRNRCKMSYATDKEENPIQYQLPLQLGMVMWHNLANEIREVCQRLLGKSHLPLLQAPSVPQCYFPLLPARNMDSQSCGRETLSWSWRWKSLTKKDKKGKSGTLRLSWTNSPALGCILQTPCYVLRRRKAPSLLKSLK